MKVTCLSILLLATSAVAYRNGLNPDGHGRRTRGEQGNNRALKTGAKDMGMSKGVKGMKGMGMKDKDVKDSKTCQSLKIKALYSEIDAGVGQTAVGETLTFPVYDYYTNEPIGTYTDQTTDILLGGQFVDCVSAGSFNFDFDASLEYPFVSQLLIAGTCLGASNSITGGTGRYACASGSESFIDGGEDYFASDLSICHTCA
jgi:hypothetical protein